jgi:hypothetical protein
MVVSGMARYFRSYSTTGATAGIRPRAKMIDSAAELAKSNRPKKCYFRYYCVFGLDLSLLGWNYD